MADLEPVSNSGLIVLPTANVPSESPVKLTPVSRHLESTSPILKIPASLHISHDASHHSPQSIVQILQFSPKHGSWLVAPSEERLPPYLVQNGHLTLITTVDPLFILLPFIPVSPSSLKTSSSSISRATTVFQPADSFVDLTTLDLSTLLSPQLLRSLCDSKIVNQVEYFRLSSQKALQWILAKYHILVQHSYVGNSHAFDTLTQYLTPEWKKLLQAQLKAQSVTTVQNIPGVDNSTNPIPSNENDPETEPIHSSLQLPDEVQELNDQSPSLPQKLTISDSKPTPKLMKQVKSNKKSIKRDESAAKFWAKRTTRSSTKSNGSGKRHRS